MEMSDALLEASPILGDWFDGESTNDESDPVHVLHGWYGAPGDSYSYQYTGTVLTDLIQFSSNHSEDEHHACYTDLEFGYDTAAIVNELKLENHQWDAVEDKGVTVTTVYTDETSIATYGESSATLKTNLITESTNVDELIAETILRIKGRPSNQITGLTWDATEDRERAAALEPYQFVRVEFENEYYQDVSLYRVLGIQHDISDEQWLVTLGLEQYRIGGSYA